MLFVNPKPRLSLPLKRGRKPRGKIKAKNLGGRKYLETLSNYLDHLRELYSHPLRVLFYDDVVVAYVTAFFNPVMRGLRCIEDASQVPGINQYLSVESVCRSTLSDANQLFDYQHLQGLIRSGWDRCGSTVSFA